MDNRFDRPAAARGGNIRLSASAIRAVGAVVLCWVVCGCTRDAVDDFGSSQAAVDRESADQVLRFAVDLLNGLAEFDNVRLPVNERLDLDSTAAELLSAGALREVVDRLNQWANTPGRQFTWRPDPLVSTLGELADLPAVESLESDNFVPGDAVELRQAVWHREVAEAACAEARDDLDRARLLFDWTVRNIQLEPDTALEGRVAPQMPWQTLLLGRGTALQRAWVFMLLCRQQGIEAVWLDRPAGGDSFETTLTAVALQGELYLFDTQLGLAVPGRDRPVATLAQAAADDRILRQLDVEADQPYPLSAGDLAKVAAMIEASPAFLSRRMAMLESQLSGDDKLVLSIQPTTLAKRLRQSEQVVEAGLWTFPYERLRGQAGLDEAGRAAQLAEMHPFVIPFIQFVDGQPIPVAALWKGRVLHLLNTTDGPNSANHFYQLARPAERHFDQQAAMAETLFELRPETFKPAAHRAKQDASYWLGLAAFERGHAATAIDYFSRRTLEATPGGPWTAGAYYNLGRVYESRGEKQQAAEAFRATDAPQQHGNLLRARQVESSAAPSDG